MKDLEKIKEFFLKDRAMTAAYEAKEEYFKPSLRKDKLNPNFLYVDIAYPAGSDVLSVGGSKTMSGQDREAGAAKALTMGNTVAKKLQAKYNIEDIEVNDLKNGKVQVFAVSDDFTKMSTPSLDEAKSGYNTNDSEGELSYEVMWTDRDYKKHYKVFKNDPNGPPDNAKKKAEAFIKSLEDKDKKSKEGLYRSIDLNEAKKETAIDMAKKQLDALGVKYEMSGNEFKPFKAIYKPVNKEDDWYDKFEEIVDLFNLGSAVKQSMSEAKEEDKVDTITMDIPLFLRMLEYSREDAKKDLDLHDVTEKANKLGKEKGILSMEDYDAIVSAAEEIQEGMGGQLDEPFFIEVSVRDARKALDLFDDQYSKSNIKMYGSNVYAANTPEDIYDLYYDLTSQDIEVLDYNVDGDLDEATDYMKRRKAMDDYAVSKKDKPTKPYNPNPSGKTDYMKRREKDLEEKITEALDKINEELCPAGKAYIKRRKAAGEKSSAYLSGRAVKVCKGQMSGKAKKK